jgi:hypothetical protein
MKARAGKAGALEDFVINENYIRAKVLAYSAKADSSTLAAGECLQSQR